MDCLVHTIDRQSLVLNDLVFVITRGSIVLKFLKNFEKMHWQIVLNCSNLRL